MLPAGQPLLATIANTGSKALLKSFNGEGVSFFNSLRTPAALVAAAAIKDAFALSAPDDIKKSRPWMLLRTTYILLQLLAFSTEIGCVFIASHAIVQLQMSADISEVGRAASLLALMKSPGFEYEYVSVRASFMTGLLAFTTAQALRARMALRRSKELSWAAMWFLLASVASLLAYNNSQSITYGGYIGLASKWIRMNGALLSSRLALAQPTPIVAAVMMALGCIAAAKALYKTLRKLADDDDDGMVSFDELSRFVCALPAQLWRMCVGEVLRGRAMPASNEEKSDANTDGGSAPPMVQP